MVTFSSADFPQADKLESVGRLVVAVSEGLHTDRQMEQALGLNSNGRQGRYYRNSAVLLGLIVNTRNHAEITSLGADFLELGGEDREEFLALCVAQLPLIRHAMRAVENEPMDASALRRWLTEAYPDAATTAERRASSALSWLEEANLITSSKGVLRPARFVGTLKIEVGHPGNLPLPDNAFPQNLASYEVDLQKHERANLIHQKLVDCVSARLLGRGVQPMQDTLIDLHGEKDGDGILFEMKSVQSDNYSVQIRRAISQLYEYRYIRGFSGARLCIVTNALDGQPAAWLDEYLGKDREIALLHTSDFQSLSPSPATAELLGPF